MLRDRSMSLYCNMGRCRDLYFSCDRQGSEVNQWYICTRELEHTYMEFVVPTDRYQINGRRLDSGESLILRDWNVVSFGQHPDTASKGDPRHDYRKHAPDDATCADHVSISSYTGFFFRHMAAKERPSEGLYRFYDVQHVLGKGAYATVVKALHRMEGNWYAIKMFSGDRLRELLSVGNVSSRRAEKRMRSTAQHLQHEVAILNTLEHRYICQLKEAFFEGYSVSTCIHSGWSSQNSQMLMVSCRSCSRARSWWGPDVIRATT